MGGGLFWGQGKETTKTVPSVLVPHAARVLYPFLSLPADQNGACVAAPAETDGAAPKEEL